jgi:hypothetical protein
MVLPSFVVLSHPVPSIGTRQCQHCLLHRKSVVLRGEWTQSPFSAFFATSRTSTTMAATIFLAHLGSFRVFLIRDFFSLNCSPCYRYYCCRRRLFASIVARVFDCQGFPVYRHPRRPHDLPLRRWNGLGLAVLVTYRWICSHCRAQQPTKCNAMTPWRARGDSGALLTDHASFCNAEAMRL